MAKATSSPPLPSFFSVFDLVDLDLGAAAELVDDEDDELFDIVSDSSWERESLPDTADWEELGNKEKQD